MARVELQDGIHYIHSAEEFSALLKEYVSPSAAEAFEEFIITAQERCDAMKALEALKKHLGEIGDALEHALDDEYVLEEAIDEKFS